MGSAEATKLAESSHQNQDSSASFVSFLLVEQESEGAHRPSLDFLINPPPLFHSREPPTPPPPTLHTHPNSTQPISIPSLRYSISLIPSLSLQLRSPHKAVPGCWIRMSKHTPPLPPLSHIPASRTHTHCTRTAATLSLTCLDTFIQVA